MSRHVRPGNHPVTDGLLIDRHAWCMIGIVISVVNNKGGVGKTTLSCNLGVAFAELERRVLVIDLDPQCNTTGILLPEEGSFNKTLYELLDPFEEDNISVEDCVYASKHSGLYCLPNVEETSGLEMDFLSNYPESLRILRNRVRTYAKSFFDFTIIDNPPNMGAFVANSLYASDFVIVPNDAGSAYGLDGLRKALELITSVQVSGNPNLRFLRLLVNRVDLRTAISRVLLDDIAERFSTDQVFKTSIPINTVLQQAEYAKETVFQRFPSSKAAEAFRRLAKEILSIIETGGKANQEVR